VCKNINSTNIFIFLLMSKLYNIIQVIFTTCNYSSFSMVCVYVCVVWHVESIIQIVFSIILRKFLTGLAFFTGQLSHIWFVSFTWYLSTSTRAINDIICFLYLYPLCLPFIVLFQTKLFLSPFPHGVFFKIKIKSITAHQNRVSTSTIWVEFLLDRSQGGVRRLWVLHA
jgi:hypothetical protein